MKTATFDITDAFHSDLTVATQGQVIRRRSISSVITSITVTAVGSGLLLLASGMADKTSSLYSASLIFGIAAIIVGISLLFFGAKQWVYLPTKSVVKLRSYYIDPSLQYAVCQAIEMRDVSQLPKLEEQLTSNVRLDIYLSADKEFAGAQTFVYEPYTYKPVTHICTAYGDQAKGLSKLF